MPTNLKPCTTPGCTNLTRSSKCDDCDKKARKHHSQDTRQAYGRLHRDLFRARVLERDPICTCPGCPHCLGRPCTAPSTRADHWPLSRKQLDARGLDPNNPQRGRGLCGPCDSFNTTQRQPGGWHPNR